MAVSMHDANGNYIGQLLNEHYVDDAAGQTVGTVDDIGGLPHVYEGWSGISVGFAYKWGSIADPSGVSIGKVDKQGNVYSDKYFGGAVGKVDATGRKALFAGAALLLLLCKEKQ